MQWITTSRLRVLALLCLVASVSGHAKGNPCQTDPRDTQDGTPASTTPLEEANLDTCTADSDCVVVDYRHCCGASKRAIHRDYIDAYEANPEWQVFDDPATCAVIGICRGDRNVTEARCNRDAEAATGRCELVFP